MTVRRRPRRTRAATKSRPRAAGRVPAPRPEYFLHHPFLHEAGVSVTADTALQVSAVYACCRLIVDSLAPAPVNVIEVGRGGVREARPDDDVAYTLNHGAPVARAPDAPTSQAIEEALFWSALTHGDGYAEIQRDYANKFFGLWPIEPYRVTPRRDENGVFYYEIQQPEGGTGRLEAVDMFHLHGPSLAGWVGDSTVYRAAKAIGIAQAAQVYSAAYFANGTVISGLLASDKTITQPQADVAKARWNESHRGPASAHGIAVIGQGLKYQAVGHSAQESQLVEARKFQVHEIARFYGVPTTLLADNEAWTNVTELYRAFVASALRTWAGRFDEEATRKLFPQRQPWREVEHDLTHLTLGSFKELVASLTQATARPFLTRNEARALVGKNSVKDGDEFPPDKTASAPAPTRPDESDEDKPEPEPKPEKRPREMNRAVVVMFARELDRYARKLKNRRADTKREIEAAEIAKFRAGLSADCEHIAAFAASCGVAFDPSLIDAGAIGVEQGEPPDLAAARLLERVTE